MNHKNQLITAGKPLNEAKKVLIMLHGRGGSAADILSLSEQLDVAEYALIAPQAYQHTWYPYSFMAPLERNEPWLSQSLATIQECVDLALESVKEQSSIYFFGFSQGACLCLEFLARNARRYGGAAAIIGGLLGDELKEENYSGNFGQMPIFLGTSNPDPHVPAERVMHTEKILTRMDASVTLQVYEQENHSIIPDQIKQMNQLIFNDLN